MPLSIRFSKPTTASLRHMGMPYRVFLALVVCASGVFAQSQIVPNRYVLVLQDPPVAARFSGRAAMESPAAESYRAQIEGRQASVMSALAARNIKVSSHTSRLINAVFVGAPGHTIDELRAIPGVISVTPMRRHKAFLNRATGLANAPVAWNALGGASSAGKGVKVGVLDSGLDLTNPMLQDSSLSAPAGFPACQSPLMPNQAAFTNGKVIVARSYTELISVGSSASNPAVDSLPDDYLPHDRIGHGTGVASVAAGNAVTAPAISTSGTPILLEGMAPKAWIGNYKIGDTFGFDSDESLIDAVEDAVCDGMDVITTSWGVGEGTALAGDPVAQAFESAAQSGAVVLAAAGNSGSDGLYQYPGFDTISSPSNAPSVISVGATMNSHGMEPSVSLNSSSAPSNLKGIPAAVSDSYFYPSVYGANTGGLVDVATLDSTGLACDPLPAYSLLGQYALILRGTCTFDTKALNAQVAGAVGFVFYMADSSAIISPQGINESGPGVMISNASGLALKAYVDSNPGALATIDTAGTEVDLSTYIAQLCPTWEADGYDCPLSAPQNTLASYSSFGPTADGMMKPDIVATGGGDNAVVPDPFAYLPPAFGMYMAAQSFDAEGELFSANGFAAANGTSFATPMTAGAAALMKQAHPGLSGLQIKSLLVNYSALDTTTDDFGDPVDAEWIGAGRLDAGAAIAGTVTAVPSTISFGILNSATLPLTKTITLTNIGSSSVTLASAVTCCSMNTGAGPLAGTLSATTVTASLSATSLAAGASATLTVTLSGSMPLAGEYSGTVNLTGPAQAAHIPFMFLVGSGTVTNVLFPLGAYFEGPPGADAGPLQMQLVDAVGVPVAGATVSFLVTPSGGVTLQSVPGTPGCSPASSTSATTCTSDATGLVQAEVILGSGLTTATNFPSITAVPEGFPISDAVVIGSDSSSGEGGAINILTPPNAGGVADTAGNLTTVAPGSYVAIYGAGLSNYTDTVATAYPTAGIAVNLPIQMDQVDVSFDVPSAGLTVPGYMVYVSPTQVNIQVPWELQGYSSAQMKVTIDQDLFGNVVTVPLANYAPAFFTSCGAVCALSYPAYTLITAANPATRGQVVQLFANGLGPVSNQPESGVQASATNLSQTPSLPTVTLGGQSAQVLFSGLAPGFPGLYQVNVTVPANSTTGPAVPISLSIGGQTTPAATIPVQ